jgi:predicted anti-sigma-YlaC factor YlaD
MFNQLTALGVGVVVFALVIGVGTIVLQQFGTAVGGTANTTVTTIQGYLGTSSGGLASWTPAIIALAVGLLFIGSLMVLQGRKA